MEDSAGQPPSTAGQLQELDAMLLRLVATLPTSDNKTGFVDGCSVSATQSKMGEYLDGAIQHLNKRASMPALSRDDFHDAGAWKIDASLKVARCAAQMCLETLAETHPEIPAHLVQTRAELLGELYPERNKT